jgi:hypothetical protein
LLLAGTVIALVRVGRDSVRAALVARKAVSGGTLLSALLIVCAFVMNRNIYNSDNYRYLIFVLTPWSLGFGLAMSDLARRGRPGRLGAWLIAGLFAAVMTAEAFLWYRDERHYVSPTGVPIRVPQRDWSRLTVVPEGPQGSKAVASHFVVPADVTHVFGGYWDVYRMAFLSGGRVVGVPLPMYPNRFRGWSRGLAPGQGKLLYMLPLAAGGKPGAGPLERHGRGMIRSAKQANWPSVLATPWIADGRDPAELSNIQVIIP